MIKSEVGETRYDQYGPLRCMAVVGNWVMCRRPPDCLPFVESVKNWMKLPLEKFPRRWIGQCLVCMNWFEHPKQTAENPAPGGTFCPVCRANKLMAPGVVNFKAEMVEHE